MSGGVDSSVSAALLKEQGFQVFGATIRLGRLGKGIASIEQAKKAARKLGIAHYSFDFQDIFKEKIIDNFCAEYKKGRTPNPCIRCNQYLKFGALLKKARQLSAQYIATGHYARIEYDKKRKHYLLKKGADAQKEQSYFLSMLRQRQLQHVLLPLGGLTKEKVRRIAGDKGLPAENRAESQEICFIPDNDYGNFLKGFMPKAAKPGPIVNKAGQVIGEHQGIIFYTIGQRKGIGIAAKEPLYVISINQKRNTIVVGKKQELFSKELIADKVNFIYIKELKSPLEVEVKVRYRHPAGRAKIFPLNKHKVKIKFDKPQPAITPGQYAVFYQGDLVIGAGTIVSGETR